MAAPLDPPSRATRPTRSIVALTSLVALLVLATITILSSNTDFSPSLDALRTRVDAGLRRSAKAPDGDRYLLGVGKADITGPVVEINFAGFADPEQVGTGLRQRLYSRAFIVASKDSPDDRIAYLVIDTAAGDTAVRNGILEGVKALGKEYEVYTQSNVAVTGTHSHSGPGAWWNYLLPQITSLGFSGQSYQAIVDGGILSIKRAHEAMTEVRTLPNLPVSQLRIVMLTSRRATSTSGQQRSKTAPSTAAAGPTSTTPTPSATATTRRRTPP